jgi:toxin ParE1/3/4
LRKPAQRLTERAASDYADILRYTRRRWGNGRFTAYRSLLNDGIAKIAREPDCLNSHTRDELQAGIRSLHIGLLAERTGYGRHILYYRVAADGVVEILRILHDRMEVSSRLP